MVLALVVPSEQHIEDVDITVIREAEVTNDSLLVLREKDIKDIKLIEEFLNE
jgi:hypothetical protein